MQKMLFGIEARWLPVKAAFCCLCPKGVDLGWKLDAMCGWALDWGSRDVGWETSAGRAGWTGVGLDNKLAGCGLQDVGDSTVLRRHQCTEMICNAEASCGRWLGAQTSREHKP